jgi:hypothetical protein
VSLIKRRPLLRKRVALALVSPILVWPIGHLLDFLESATFANYILIGGVFGICVLAPFAYKRPYHKSRISLLTAGSILIYAFMVELAAAEYGPLSLNLDLAIAASGLIGALLVGGMVQLLASLHFSWKIWLLLSAAGLLGGFVFNFAWEDNNYAVVALGYGAWQLPVCIALNIGAGKS